MLRLEHGDEILVAELVGWPKVLDCRAAMGHTYEFSWAWRLILDFFDAQS